MKIIKSLNILSSNQYLLKSVAFLEGCLYITPAMISDPFRSIISGKVDSNSDFLSLFR